MTLKVGVIATILRFLIRENQIREKSGNVIAKKCGHSVPYFFTIPFNALWIGHGGVLPVLEL